MSLLLWVCVNNKNAWSIIVVVIWKASFVLHTTRISATKIILQNLTLVDYMFMILSHILGAMAQKFLSQSCAGKYNMTCSEMYQMQELFKRAMNIHIMQPSCLWLTWIETNMKYIRVNFQCKTPIWFQNCIMQIIKL